MLFKYFLEIKNRIFLIFLTWFFTVLVCYCYKETLLFFLIKFNPVVYKTYSFYFITTNLLDLFNVYLKISFFLSYQVTLFVSLYHILLFFYTALFKYELNILKYSFLLSIICYCITLIIFNLYILPNIWAFFLSYQTNQLEKGLNIFFEAQITEYARFYIESCWSFIIINQVFVLIFVCLNFVKDKIIFIKKTRKLIYASFLVFSTIITPPDIISQVIVSLLLMLFYEAILLFLIVKF